MIENTTTTNTNYLAGEFQYKNSVLQFFPQAEGYVKNTSGAYSYVFNYTDHLGNVRVSYSDIDGNDSIQADEILEESHYYPFGLKHEDYNSNNQQPNYNYKYNGKELQTELGLNMYDMDMRDYDPAIGRWVNQDPVVHFNYSPYSAFDNNPVFWADPSGANSEIPSWMQDAWNNSGSGTTHWVNNGNGEFKKAKQNKKLGGPGFDFDSIDAAAIDFAMQYNGISIINKTELGAAIYKKKNGKYSYTTPKGHVVYSKSAKKIKEMHILLNLD